MSDMSEETKELAELRRDTLEAESHKAKDTKPEPLRVCYVCRTTHTDDRCPECRSTLWSPV
jgi:hypothetical protein